ncbi:13775_t:CDS:2 [Cetraspora pellucida]|uniref:13775_t:CDS:1 n=1 Tax=Cetraspora pellucida TaxID=1433469 RepID=A0A9N9A1U0_9GLOM|nr:13775_t:CDS:2 [Cetraspora pellucida]
MIHALNEALSKLWNVTVIEVPNLLNIEKNLCTVDGLLKPFLEQNEESFGGTYINVKRNKIIIMIVDETKKDIILNSPDIQPHIELLIFQPALNSLSSLKNSSLQIVANSRRHRPIEVLMYIDIEENNIVIFIPFITDERNKPFIDIRNKPFMDSISQYNPVMRLFDVNMQGQPSRKRPRNSTHTKREIGRQIINGGAIYNLGSKAICTAGFWVIDEELNNYLVTAGHCIDRNNTTPDHNTFYLMPLNSSEKVSSFSKKNDEIGPMVFHDLKETDFGLIRITNVAIKPTKVIRNTNSDPYRQLFIRDAETISTHGAHLCKSGTITFVTCGYIKSFEGYSFRGNDVFDNFIVTNFLSNVGDSGGPVFYLRDLPYVSLHGIVIKGFSSREWGDLTFNVKADYIISAANRTIKLGVIHEYYQEKRLQSQ